MGCLTGLASKNPERDADIVKRHHAGESYTGIGRVYGIHAKRVREIIDRRGGLKASECSASLKTACAAKDREMNYRNKRRFDVEAEVPGIGMVRHMVVAMDLDHLTLKVRRSYPVPGVQVLSVIELGRV